MISVEVSPGELLDKISILEIKLERIADERALALVRRELASLQSVRAQALPESSQLISLTTELKRANETLWDLEDSIRECERAQRFDARFVELARSIYRTNDRRAALKRQINELLSSSIAEVKSYSAY
jgi:vacuolar-type H+-ATPase subunit I/STV1